MTALRSLIGIVCVMVAAVCPLEAQEAPGPTPLFRGLFGGAEPLGARDQVFDFTASLFSSYVDEIETGDVEPLPGDWFQGGSATLNFQKNWDRASLGAFAGAGVSYVDSLREAGEDPWLERWGVGARGSYSRPIARRTDFGVDGSVSYSPYFSFGMDGGIGGGFGQIGGGFASGPDRVQGVPGLDYTVDRSPNVRSNGSAALVHNLTNRSSLEAFYGIQHLDFIDNVEGYLDRVTQRAGGRFRYRINEWVGARAGYTYRWSLWGDGEPTINHDIDVGVDGGYGREFQIARRTTFSFDTRSGVFVSDSFQDAETLDPRTRLFIGGTAALAHRWGRSWQADVRYDRSASYVDGLAEPVFSNRASATLRGVPLRRLDFIATAAYSHGDVGFTRSENGFATATATAQLRAALARNLAAFAQYFYYHYDFEQGVVLPGGVPRQLDRQGASFGLTYWLPLW